MTQLIRTKKLYLVLLLPTFVAAADFFFKICLYT